MEMRPPVFFSERATSISINSRNHLTSARPAAPASKKYKPYTKQHIQVKQKNHVGAQLLTRPARNEFNVTMFAEERWADCARAPRILYICAYAVGPPARLFPPPGPVFGGANGPCDQQKNHPAAVLSFASVFSFFGFLGGGFPTNRSGPVFRRQNPTTGPAPSYRTDALTRRWAGAVPAPAFSLLLLRESMALVNGPLPSLCRFLGAGIIGEARWHAGRPGLAVALADEMDAGASAFIPL